jgi:hypothetical protein
MKPSEYPVVRNWITAFQDGPDHVDYLWEHADLATWISASSLFWPRFVEVRGCVLWERVYEESNFADWWARLGADVPRIEGVLNQVRLWQVIPSRETGEDERALLEVARCLRNCWEASLQVHFPTRRFEVVVSATEDGPVLTSCSRGVALQLPGAAK